MDEEGHPVFVREEYRRVYVKGPVFGFSLTNSFAPVRPLSLTGQWQSYGKNFLTA